MESKPRKPFATAGVESFWLAVWLAVLLFACKACCFGRPDPLTFHNLLTHATDVCVGAGADVLFCAIVGLVLWPLLGLLNRKPSRLHMGLRVSLYALYLGVAFYGILSVKIFEYLRSPLTYAMLYLAGDTANMQSSILHYLSWDVAMALIFGPFLPLLATWASIRWLSPNLRFRFAIPALLFIAVIWWANWAYSTAHGPWVGSRDDRRIADNPHSTLVMSIINSVFGAGRIEFHESFPPEFADDFKTVAERGLGAPTPSIPRKPRNVIVIISESVGTQMLNVYGSDFDTWPRLKAETRNALIFDNYYAHIGNTANSLVSILLSVYTPPLDFREITKENPNIKGATSAQVLKPLGYRTAFISAGDNDYSNQSALLKDRGFDVVWDYRHSAQTPHFSWGVADRHLVDMTLKFIDEDAKMPFCIYAWTQGTHHDYEPYPGQQIVEFPVDASKWKVMSWDLGRYLNALREEDRQIGRLFDELRARKLDQDTLVVITGDHGEAFGYPHPSYGHSGKVHQEDVNVPFIIWSPALFTNSARSKAIGGHVDLSPTVLDLLNVPLPGSWQGRSLLDPGRQNRTYFCGVMDYRLIGVREGDYKYIFNATEGLETLYNLSTDPGEQINVAPQNPDICQQLRQRLAAWVKSQENHQQARQL